MSHSFQFLVISLISLYQDLNEYDRRWHSGFKVRARLLDQSIRYGIKWQHRKTDTLKSHYISNENGFLLTIIIIRMTEGVVVGSQLPSDIKGESQRGIHLCVACLGQIDLVEPCYLLVKPKPISSNLNASLSHEYATVDSLGGTLGPSRWILSRKSSTQRYRDIIVLDILQVV